MVQGNSPTSVQKPLPTMYDLPSEYPEELGLPDEFHDFQPQLLRETCQLPAYLADNIFIGTDINLYY
ncbi:MAG: Uma2 family endonuclease, partial [Thermosynechococcaceae cyanobacterium]